MCNSDGSVVKQRERERENCFQEIDLSLQPFVVVTVLLVVVARIWKRNNERLFGPPTKARNN